MLEYWILDPGRESAEFFQLGSEGKYAAALIGTDGVYRSSVIEPLWIRVDWLWQKPLPTELSIFREWGLIK